MEYEIRANPDMKTAEPKVYLVMLKLVRTFNIVRMYHSPPPLGAVPLDSAGAVDVSSLAGCLTIGQN